MESRHAGMKTEGDANWRGCGGETGGEGIKLAP